MGGSGGSTDTYVDVQMPLGQRSSKVADNEAQLGVATANGGGGTALKPIQENETDESSFRDFGHSSLNMSLLEGEFMQSNGQLMESNMTLNGVSAGMNDLARSDLAMSLDSTTFNSIMRQSGAGQNMGADIMDLVSSTNTNPDDDDNGEANGASNQVSFDKSSLPVGTYAVKTDRSASNSSSSRGGGSNKNVGDSSSTMNSFLSMDDNVKRANSGDSDRGKEGQNQMDRESSGRSRSGRPSVSRNTMMSEISQWTMDNPFGDSNVLDGGGGGEGSGGGGGGGSGEPGKNKPQQRQQLIKSIQGDCPVDMGDFHSLAGSLGNSLDL